MNNNNFLFKKKKVKVEDYLQDTDYLNLHGWMINKLNLKGVKLLVFALIHSYTKGKNGYFCGSQTYLARWSNSVKSNVNEILKQLAKDGLITKYGEEITKSSQVVYYVSNVDSDKLVTGEHDLEFYKSAYGTGSKTEPVQKLDRYENTTTPDQKVDGGRPESGHNINNILDNNNLNVVDKNELETFLSKKFEEIMDTFGYTYDEEVEFKGNSEELDVRIEDFKRFLIENLKLEGLKKFIDLPIDKAYEVFDVFMKTTCPDRDIMYKQYSLIKNPRGFTISKLKEALGTEEVNYA